MAVDTLNPVTGAPQFLDTFGPDLAIDQNAVADFAAKVGTRLIGTTAERLAYQFSRKGLAWFDTTLMRALYHDGNGWVDRTVGAFAIDSLYVASSNFETPVLSKLEGRARLSGFLTNAGNPLTIIGSTSYPLGTVPAGFRPAKTVLRPAAPSPISGGQAWITVNNAGLVQYALQNGATYNSVGAWGIGFEFEWEIAV